MNVEKVVEVEYQLTMNGREYEVLMSMLETFSTREGLDLLPTGFSTEAWDLIEAFRRNA